MSSAQKYDVIVIGGGASGMMAAGQAGSRGKRVLLLEKNKKLGAKLAITGGTRCNITNAEEDTRTLLGHYGNAEQFLFSPFSQFGVKDTFAFFEALGLPLVVEARKRAFPHTHKAEDVVRAMTEFMRKNKVEVRLGRTVEKIVTKGSRIEKVIADSEEFFADSFVFATGGISHPETGSTGDGFAWLAKINLPIAKPTPTIVPLKVKESWIKDVSGVTLSDMKITFMSQSKKKFSRTGAVLFTHFGLSGPLILNSSSQVADYLHEGPVAAHIDMRPNLDLGVLDKLITEHFAANSNKILKNTFKELAPQGMSDALLALMPAIDPGKKVHSVTKEERRVLAELLKDLPLTITDLMGLDRAVVADGGLPLTEIDTRTMRVNKYPNLFVTGDLLHINRPTGGYSLQLCWTTGFVAGSAA